MLRIDGHTFSSHLLIGSARYPDPLTRIDAIKASGAEIVTVSIRRVSLDDADLMRDLAPYFLLPNTAGCYTAQEAVRTAHLAREALGTNWIKLEVIGDEKTLFPDIPELLKAAYQLVHDGFVVLPYCSDDPITCRKLADIGCSAVMPLASPIGSGMGINNRYNLEMIRESLSLPIIIDAGIGTASDAALCMEMGMDGILLNTAIAGAGNPVEMARAMRLACEGGRLAYQAGRIPRKRHADPSTPGII